MMKSFKKNLLWITCLLVIAFSVTVLLSCKNSVAIEKHIGYDLSKPDGIQELPPILREISGIALIDDSTIACIQDENGILFIYDLQRSKIKEQYSFHENGDYEGICKVDTTIFILRSDGALFEISNYLLKNFNVKSYSTQMTGSNNEGLCYDRQHNRLLIARKNKISKGKEFKNKRAIYEFDLQSKVLNVVPVFEFDVDSIIKLAIKEKMELPVKKKGKSTEPFIRFASSEIAIHPLTGKLFLLSSADHLLFIINEKGTIETMRKLDPFLFNKPEGITFHKNGDMLITNEGQNKNSTLLRFKYSESKNL